MNCNTSQFFRPLSRMSDRWLSVHRFSSAHLAAFLFPAPVRQCACSERGKVKGNTSLASTYQRLLFVFIFCLFRLPVLHWFVLFMTCLLLSLHQLCYLQNRRGTNFHVLDSTSFWRAYCLFECLRHGARNGNHFIFTAFLHHFWRFFHRIVLFCEVY